MCLWRRDPFHWLLVCLTSDRRPSRPCWPCFTVDSECRNLGSPGTSMLSRIQWLMEMYQVIINSSSICSPPFLIHVSTSSNIKELSPTFISRMVSWNNWCIFHSDVFENLPPLLEKHPGIMWPPSYLQILTPAMVTSRGHMWSLIAAREATTPIFSHFQRPRRNSLRHWSSHPGENCQKAGGFFETKLSSLGECCVSIPGKKKHANQPLIGLAGQFKLFCDLTPLSKKGF